MFVDSLLSFFIAGVSDSVTPWTATHQAVSVHKFPRQGYWNSVFLSSRIFPGMIEPRLYVGKARILYPVWEALLADGVLNKFKKGHWLGTFPIFI